MIGQASNDLLVAIEQKVLARVPQKMRPAFDRTVNAGLKVMYSPAGQQQMEDQFSKSQDAAFNIGEGVAKLIGVLFKQSKGTMPAAIAVPAASFFMCEVLDFFAKAGAVELTSDLIAQTTKETGAAVLQLFGVTPEKLQQMMAERVQSTQEG